MLRTLLLLAIAAVSAGAALPAAPSAAHARRRAPSPSAALSAIAAARADALPHVALPDAALPDGAEVMRRVNARTRERASRLRLDMTLQDSRQRTFHKAIVAERKRFDGGYRTRYRITAPDHEAGIELLLAEDQPSMWMYFPNTQQRLRVATRGFSALASDFSCEDLQVGLRLADYDFRTLDREIVDGTPRLRVSMTPRTERLRSELGFSRAIGWVREDIWFIVRADYYDETDAVFKTFTATELEPIQGIWTARRLTMDNRRAQHRSDVRLLDVDYSLRLDDATFAPERIGGGDRIGVVPSGAPPA